MFFLPWWQWRSLLLFKKKSFWGAAVPPGESRWQWAEIFGVIVHVYCTTMMCPQGEYWEAKKKWYCCKSSETIRVDVVLSTERIGANKIVALYEATHILISSACCEILIVTFYICAVWVSVLCAFVENQQSWWWLHFSSAMPVCV